MREPPAEHSSSQTHKGTPDQTTAGQRGNGAAKPVAGSDSDLDFTVAGEDPRLRENTGDLTTVANPSQGAGGPDSGEAETLYTPRKEGASSPAGTAASTTAGGRFGEYELLEEVARGGMGVVFKARQVRLNRTVALKMILSGQLAGSEDVQRFYSEAEAAAQLDHPGIVPVYEVGEHGKQHYFSMGFIEGESLAAKVSRGPLPPREAARMTQEVAEAVEYAHGKGIVHRDLKPANVLVGTDGHPRVTDFGLAKRAEGASQLTGTGQVLGTPSYMPPEQAAGRPELIGTKSDVYSLGAMLYALLTGRPPFQAASVVETLMQVVNTEAVPPRQLNGAIPPDLENICLKCLEKEPGRRYGSARDLGADLERFLNGETTVARPIGLPARGWRWCRRNRVVASLLAIVAVAMIGGTAVSTYFWLLAEDRAKQSAKSETEMRKQRNIAVEAEQRRTDQLRDAYFAEAQAHRWSGRSERRFKGLEAVRLAAEIEPSAKLRDEAIAGMALTDIRVKRQWSLDPPSPVGVHIAFDASHERYARYDAKGEISVHRIADGEELLRLPGEGMPVEWVLRFSPDGRFLAAKYEGAGVGGAGKSACQVWNLERREVQIKFPFAVHIGAVNFSPDCRFVAAGEQNGTIHLFDLEAGEEAKKFSSVVEPYGIAFHPTEKRVAVSCHLRTQVLVHDLEGDAGPRTLASPAGVRGMAWSPDGKMLAGAGADSRVYVWDATSNGPPAILTGHTHTVTTVIFNRAGNLLASYGWDGITRLWDPFLGRQLVSIPGEVVQGSSFNADDTQLPFILSPREVGLWEVANGVELRTLGRGAKWPPFGLSAAYCAEGRLLATASEEGIRIWDVPSGREVGLIREPAVFAVAFHPENRRLYATGSRGVGMWPITSEGEGAARVTRIGTREGFEKTGVLQRAALNRGGTLLAAGSPGGFFALAVGGEGTVERIVMQGRHLGAISATVSDDGKWGASGTWKGTGVNVWDLEKGKLARTLPVEESANVQFSPDGKWLVVATGGAYQFWDTETWEKKEEIARDRTGDVPGLICYSPDGKLLALRLNLNRGFTLFHGETRERLGEFEAGPQMPLCFGPDGASLVVAGEEGLVQIWDLRRVRARLAEMKLEGELPALREEKRSAKGRVVVGEGGK